MTIIKHPPSKAALIALATAEHEQDIRDRGAVLHIHALAADPSDEFKAMVRSWDPKWAAKQDRLANPRLRLATFDINRPNPQAEPWRSAASRLIDLAGVTVRKWDPRTRGFAYLARPGKEIDAPPPVSAEAFAIMAHEVFHHYVGDGQRLKRDEFGCEVDAWRAVLDHWDAEALPQRRQAVNTAVSRLQTYSGLSAIELRQLLAEPVSDEAIAASEAVLAGAYTEPDSATAPGIPHSYQPVPADKHPCEVCGLPETAAIHAVDGDSADEEATLALRPEVVLTRPLRGPASRTPA